MMYFWNRHLYQISNICFINKLFKNTVTEVQFIGDTGKSIRITSKSATLQGVSILFQLLKSTRNERGYFNVRCSSTSISGLKCRLKSCLKSSWKSTRKEHFNGGSSTVSKIDKRSTHVHVPSTMPRHRKACLYISITEIDIVVPSLYTWTYNIKTKSKSTILQHTVISCQ